MAELEIKYPNKFYQIDVIWALYKYIIFLILYNQQFMIKGACKRTAVLLYNSVYFIFSIWLIPVYLTIVCLQFAYRASSEIINRTMRYLVNDSTISKIVKSVIGRVHDFFQAINVRDYSARPTFLRHLRSQQQVANILHRASSNPDQITENQKVLLLMQKMRKLEETIFQQSIDRRKAEQQLFDLKIQFSEKNGALIRQRSENVENLNKLNVLKFQLSEKTDLLEKSKKHVAELQKQLGETREKMTIEEKEKQAAKQQIPNEQHTTPLYV